MEKQELLKLVDEITDELFSKNKEAVEREDILIGTLDLAVRLSCLVNVKILEKLGLIEEIK